MIKESANRSHQGRMAEKNGVERDKETVHPCRYGVRKQGCATNTTSKPNLAMDSACIGQHTEAAAERNFLQLGSAMEDKSVIEKVFITEICVPPEFSEHLDRALVRLAYLFPEFQVSQSDLDQLTIRVRHTAKLDTEAFSRELHHALAREKIRTEGEPLRRALLHSIFER